MLGRTVSDRERQDAVLLSEPQITIYPVHGIATAHKLPAQQGLNLCRKHKHISQGCYRDCLDEIIPLRVSGPPENKCCEHELHVGVFYTYAGTHHKLGQADET